MIIRHHKATDLELIKYGYFEIFNSDYLNKLDVSFQKRTEIQETIQKYALQDISNYHLKFLVAEENEIPIGFISFERNQTLSTIRAIYVKKENRKNGIAKELLKAMYQKCSDSLSYFVRVTAVDSNKEAIGLYKSEGFIDVGTKLTCKL